MLIVRSENNPILKPKRIHSWEAEAVYNGCPIAKDGNIYLLYRALSLPHYHSLAGTILRVSDIGIAVSKDGVEFHDRKRLITSEEQWDRFGCEDPRVTKLADKYYIFYTALSEYPFRAEGIKVGLAISNDLVTVAEKHLITPFNAKGMALFPEKINNKYWVVLTVNTDLPPAKICLASFDKVEDIWNQNYWQEWHLDFESHSLPLQRNSGDQIEVGSPPVKTDQGWLMFHSYTQNYFTPNPVFGVEAVLLDLNDPTKIIAKTDAPLLTPEEYYERIGFVPNSIFPSGALMQNDLIYLYYGAADTTCCLAIIDSRALLTKLTTPEGAVGFKREENNPIIIPIPDHPWEAKATFNPGAVYLDNKVHLIYRAMSNDNTSTLGYATSSDGIHIDYRSPTPIYQPREDFEQKLIVNGNSGCEDPRLTLIDEKIYMCYTAYDGRNPPRVAFTSITVDDFLHQQWNWVKPVLISPPDIDDKDACVYPTIIDGKYFIIHRSGNDIDSAMVSTLNFDGHTWIEEYRWILPRAGRWDSKKVGIAAPPIKTNAGWVMFYHGVSEDGIYRIGAILLDPMNPKLVIARTDEPLLEPITDYEKNGQVPNIVFPCGAVLINNTFFLYYGGADTVTGVATIDRDKLLHHFETCRC